MTPLVFGRTEYAQPLEQVGAVEEDEDVRAAFPGEWVELVVIPETEIHWIVRSGKEVDRERGFDRARA
jgi:hypothetical protein